MFRKIYLVVSRLWDDIAIEGFVHVASFGVSVTFVINTVWSVVHAIHVVSFIQSRFVEEHCHVNIVAEKFIFFKWRTGTKLNFSRISFEHNQSNFISFKFHLVPFDSEVANNQS